LPEVVIANKFRCGTVERQRARLETDELSGRYCGLNGPRNRETGDLARGFFAGFAGLDLEKVRR